MKKLFAVLLTLVLVLSMGTIALAAGDGSITVDNAVNGEIYTIYKMFSYEPVDGSATQGRYTVVSAWSDFIAEGGDGAAYLEIDKEAGTIVWKGNKDDDGNPDATEVAALAKAAVAYATTNKITATDTDTAKNGKAEFTGLELGYYAVDTSLGTICSLTTTNKTAKVSEKNNGATIDKKIVEDNEFVDANNVAIGDTVNYQSIVTAGKGTVNYVIHDTMSEGLTFKEDSVVVTYNGETLVAGEDKDYVLSVPGTACEDGCTFEIDFTDTFEAKLSENDKVYVTYSATLNEDAVIGSTGNPNEIYLTYGNAQESTKDYVITYTTKLTINKVDVNDIALPGAGFTLYKDEVKEGNEVGEEITDVTTFEWEGLAEGKYILVETKVPEGYNQAANIEFVIVCTEPKEVKTVADTATWSTTSTEITAVENSVFEGKVINRTGTLLPETGGIGTTIFYVVGGLLMAAAFVLLVSKKRMASFA